MQEISDAKIGARLRELRKAAGLAPAELADHISISAAQVLKLEKGVNRITVLQLIEIANAVGFTLDYFAQEFYRPKLANDRTTAQLLSNGSSAEH